MTDTPGPTQRPQADPSRRSVLEAEDQLLDEPLDGGAWSYLEEGRPVTVRTEPAFVTAYAILDDLVNVGLAPITALATLSLALVELTVDGSHQPGQWLRLADVTDATTNVEAFADAVTALNELLVASEDLALTLRLTRARALVREAAAEPPFDPSPTPPSTLPGSGPGTGGPR